MAFMDLVHADNDEHLRRLPRHGAACGPSRGCASGCSAIPSGRRRRNIAHHYDLGNDFYGLWLDETMTYSSALFETGQESLGEGADAKYASMVDQMGVNPGRPRARDRLRLGRVRRICRQGARAEGHRPHDQPKSSTTMRAERIDRGRAVGPGRVQAAGLPRREAAPMTASPSIEMFEAVGEQYWPVYFRHAARPAEARRERHAADHHCPAPPLGGLPRGARLHPEIHLSRRHAARARWCCATRSRRPGLE